MHSLYYIVYQTNGKNEKNALNAIKNFYIREKRMLANDHVLIIMCLSAFELWFLNAENPNPILLTVAKWLDTLAKDF